jgi:hypothetical protein
MFWQCREGALAALEAWEASAGPHKKWQGNRKKLALLQDAGEDLNAFYDRQSFSFFHQTVGNATFFSGASTDVVAHELGHGLLDSVRPDFFDVNFLEVGAFHEAFGDCMAILTSLADTESRKKLLDVTTTLKKKNFVESTAEDLSEGIRRLVPNHNAAEPRHALNKFQFQLPESLPVDGGPGELINEVHSFGMLFSGCFWDLIANMFAAAGSQSEATLRNVARSAGAILIEGTKAAVVTPRFVQSVGRAMVLADQSLNGGANRDHIRNAFQAHAILLGSNAMMAPAMTLGAAAPKGATLSAGARKALLDRLGREPSARLSVAAADVFGTHVVKAVRTREVPLAAVDKSLKGVVATAHEPVMIGQSGGRAAVMGALPNPIDTELEVQTFVKSLLEHNQIEFAPTSTTAKKSAAAKKSATKKAPTKRSLVASLDGRADVPTHVIRSVGGKRVLERIRFRCFGC